MRAHLIILVTAGLVSLAFAMDMDSHSTSDGNSPIELSPENPGESLIPVPHRISHHHGVPILETSLSPEEKLYWENYTTETYFNTPSSHRSALWVHIALYVSSYVFLYPIILVFWNIHHWLYLPALTAHTALILLSVVNYWIFKASITELLPHNAFGPMTFLLFLGAIIHWFVALLAVTYKYLNIDDEFGYAELDADHDDDHMVSLNSPELTLRESNLREDSFELEDLGETDGHLKTSNSLMLQRSPSKISQFLLKFPVFKKATQVFGKTALTLAGLINWALFAYFLAYLPTGIATYCVYGLDNTMFNMLAHFIKGGVFFVLGMVTLARYCGAFRRKGWAWNHRFVNAKKAVTPWIRLQSNGLWTMEFVESALILFYGSTNVFLEHLAGSGGPWTAKDLQHASIAFIYIGCGLCGVLVERKLSSWRYQRAVDNLSYVADSKTTSTIVKATPGFSPNPFPILTIYWTGIIMSKHEQASPLSTEIHIQWGNLFVIACAFRLITYLYCALAPANLRALTQPLSPMTELVVSFCLLCGGMIFMESTDPVIHLYEYYGYTSMFTLNVSVGIVALIMAWELSVFAIKDALVRRMGSQKI